MSKLPLLVIRPEPGNAATLVAARALGLNAWGEPLFRIAPVAWTPPPPSRFDAVLIGSANALRHGGPALAGYSSLPAYVVGQATAEAAREAGFTVADTGSGGLQQIVDRLSRDGRRRVLRLAGAEHVALAPAEHTRIVTAVVYEALPLPMNADCAEKLARGAVALLHSAAAARHFAAECARRGIDRTGIALACLGPRIAEAAGDRGWACVASAERPDDTALLALAGRMCQNARFGDKN
ncbi:MAG: uroporphyrinogen-III synthase [Novosphingobium sp.]|nr:uroporphyrinogen-III synthase [Novosphingobium sp.]